jgi:NhaP-type Na+/H+ or K+/H+ antiporter
MNRVLAVLQLGLALILFLFALATLVNMILITTRPETISVVNTLIGQIVVIVCLVALGRILMKKGLARFSSSRQPEAGAADEQQDRA